MHRSTQLGVSLFLLLGACASDSGAPPEEKTGTILEPIWTNGDFEGDPVSTTPPTGWTLTTYLNTSGVSGTATTPPPSFAALNLTATAGQGKTETYVVGGTTLSQADPDLGSGQSFRYPLFGSRAARVNYKNSTDYGKDKNAN